MQYRDFLRFIYDTLHRKEYKKRLKVLESQGVPIIASNCVGGIFYHSLGLEFLSPTINLYICHSDFIKFCSDLQHYLAIRPEPNGLNHGTPILKLDDINLYCVHYKSYEDAITKWKERKSRLTNNIVLIMSERDGCTYDNLLEFDSLPYKNKVVFVHKSMPEIKSAVHIPGTELDGIDGDYVNIVKYKDLFSGKRYIDDFDFVSLLLQSITN